MRALELIERALDRDPNYVGYDCARREARCLKWVKIGRDRPEPASSGLPATADIDGDSRRRRNSVPSISRCFRPDCRALAGGVQGRWGAVSRRALFAGRRAKQRSGDTLKASDGHAYRIANKPGM
jgi:hypothetical protein